MRARWSAAAAALAACAFLFGAARLSGQAAGSQSKGKGKNVDGPGGVIAVNGVRDENLPPPPKGPAPRMIDGKPDFSGVWLIGNYAFGNMGGPLPLQPWAQKVLEDRRAVRGKDDPEAKCLPAGVPRLTPYPIKFVHSPKLLVMLFEGNVHSYRQVF